MTQKDILDELHQPVKALRDQIPAVFSGYAALNTAALGDAILMNGGHGTVHAPRAFEAFQEFARR